MFITFFWINLLNCVFICLFTYRVFVCGAARKNMWGNTYPSNSSNSNLLLDLLGLDAVPLLQLALLLRIQLLEVAANVPDGALQLRAIELRRVEANNGLQARQLRNLLLVHGLQEGDLLLQRLHLVLAGDAVDRLPVQVVLQLTQLLEQPSLLVHILGDLLVDVVQLATKVLTILQLRVLEFIIAYCKLFSL